MLEDARRATDRLNARYPEDLRQLGFGGTVKVNVRVAVHGGVDSVVVLNSSGIPALDEAAEGVARGLRFSKPDTSAWVDLDLTFQPSRAATGLLSELPQLTDRRRASEAVWSRLPERFRKSKIDVARMVELLVDSAGTVLSAKPAVAACPSDFEAAALAGAAALQFTHVNPGQVRLPQRTIVTFDFQSDSVVVRLPGESRRGNSSREAHGDTPPADTPPATGRTQVPHLRNKDLVTRRLQQNYPADLRLRGVGGTAVVWLFVDEKGDVTRRMIKTSSGHCALDDAALVVAAAMRFQPALLDGKPTRVWVDMDIAFRVR